ncbi:MAG: ester cyclase [Elusimicrobia bacterium]|nr:ester cyclase [Elusimicrobiota bacterium]
MRTWAVLFLGLSFGGWVWAGSAAPVTGNKAVLKKVYEAFNTANPGALEGLISEKAVSYDLPTGINQGMQGTQELVILLHRAFPDLKIQVEDMIAEGDRVAARVFFSGTHEGEFLGIPATGRQVAYTGIHYVKFSGGKIVALWSFMDHERLRRQLGEKVPSAK